MRAWALLLLLLPAASLGRPAAADVQGDKITRRKYLCPPDFVRHGSSCYYFSSNMASWFDAHFDCKDRNSEMAIMEKGWEDRNMRTYLNKPELARLERWIGGIYNWEMKRWVWGANGGNPLKYQGFSQMAKNSNPKWNCIIMDPSMNYKWGSRLCLDKKHYICEVPLKRLKPPQPHATQPYKPKKNRDPNKPKKPRDPNKRPRDPNKRQRQERRERRLRQQQLRRQRKQQKQQMQEQQQKEREREQQKEREREQQKEREQEQLQRNREQEHQQRREQEHQLQREREEEFNRQREREREEELHRQREREREEEIHRQREQELQRQREREQHEKERQQNEERERELQEQREREREQKQVTSEKPEQTRPTHKNVPGSQPEYHPPINHHQTWVGPPKYRYLRIQPEFIPYREEVLI